MGVRKWEHGRVACWLPKDRSEAILHWIDERTDTYGIIRADASANRRLDRFWRALTAELAPGPGDLPEDREQAAPDPGRAPSAEPA